MAAGWTVAYVRKSGGGDPAGSYADQRAGVLQLASQHRLKLPDPGPDRKAAEAHPRWLVDWHKSGGKDGSERPGYAALLELCASGRVGAVLAYDQDRLSRDVEHGVQLLKLAEQHGFRVLVPGTDLSDPAHRTYAEVAWSFAGDYRRKREQSARNREKRYAKNGEPPSGALPYGHSRVQDPVTKLWRIERTDPKAIARVVDAYRTERSGVAAAKALNAAKVAPPRKARDGSAGLWRSEVVRRIVKREAPHLLGPPGGKRRQPLRRPNPLAGLVRCGCGDIMSPSSSHGGRYRMWTCVRGANDADHPRPYSVSDITMRRFAAAEVARYRVPGTALVDHGKDVQAERAAVLEDKRRLGVMYRAQAMDDDAFAAAIAANAAKLAALDEADTVLALELPEHVEWSDDDAAADELGALLRYLWPQGINCQVQAGRLRPIDVQWRQAGWRTR